MIFRNIEIPHKNIVKYLGINLDNYLYFDNHRKIQLQKARAAFMSQKRLFFCKHLDPEIKLQCYKLLIRPIITYGCNIWFNQSASGMESIRVFERKCLRSCLGKHRSTHSNFQHYISNENIYNLFDFFFYFHLPPPFFRPFLEYC